jgi:hypothetical protein
VIDTLKDIYITMLSGNIDWGEESRVFEAQWILCEIGVPMTLEVSDESGDWKEWAKWTEE